MENINIIKRCVYDTPLLLLSFKNKETINYINNLLPYSTGIEIECYQSVDFDIERFKNIPNIIAVDCDTSEQRFRIPNGIAGMICLYNICEELKISCLLNKGSGIHLHTDMTQSFHKIDNTFISKQSKMLLSELDSWNYKGIYNKRECTINSGGVWVRFQTSFKTMEVRICEMSFDYSVLIKRILHCQSLVTKLNNLLDEVNVVNKFIDLSNTTNILEYFKYKDNSILKVKIFKELEEYKNKLNPVVEIAPEVDIKSIIKSRLK